jgi:hypothetical protein
MPKLSLENIKLTSTETFNLITNLLEKNYDTHLNIIWSATGLLLAAIGWILTSKEAREYITQDAIAKMIVYITIIVMFVIHYFLLLKTQSTSIALSDSLKSLLPDESKILITKDLHIFMYEITDVYLYTRGAVTLFLFLVLISLIFRCNSRKTGGS